MKKRSHVIWFSVITLIFIVTRILALKSAGSFWFDEAFSVHFASKPFSEIWTFLQFEHNPLVHFLSLHFWIKLFGASELSVRALSLLAGLGSLFGLYWLGKTFFSKQTGLWAMFFMTISSLFLYHQTEARMYSLLALFALLSIGSFWKYFQLRSESRQQESGFMNLWLLLYFVSTTLLVHTHITAWVLPVAVCLFWFTEQKHKLSQWKAWICTNFLILGSFLLWFIPVMKNKFLAGHISQGWFFFQQDSGFLLSHLKNYFIIGETNLLFISGATTLAGFVFLLSFIQFEKPPWLGKIKHFFDKSYWPFSFSIQWTKEIRFLLCLILVGVLFGLALKITVTKYLLISGLAVFLLMAKGMEKFPVTVKVVVASFFLISVLPMQSKLLFSQRHHWEEVADQVALTINSYPETTIISHSFVWALPLSFYYDNHQQVRPFYPLNDNLTLEERIVRYNWQGLVNSDNVELLQELVLDNERILLLSSTPNSDERDPVKNWFYQQGWKLKKVYNWQGYGDPELLLFVKD